MNRRGYVPFYLIYSYSAPLTPFHSIFIFFAFQRLRGRCSLPSTLEFRIQPSPATWAGIDLGSDNQLHLPGILNLKFWRGSAVGQHAEALQGWRHSPLLEQRCQRRLSVCRTSTQVLAVAMTVPCGAGALTALVPTPSWARFFRSLAVLRPTWFVFYRSICRLPHPEWMSVLGTINQSVYWLLSK